MRWSAVAAAVCLPELVPTAMITWSKRGRMRSTSDWCPTVKGLKVPGKSMLRDISFFVGVKWGVGVRSEGSVWLGFDGGVVFDDEVVDDEGLTFHRVFAHVEFEEFGDGVFFAESDAVEAHVGAYEASEFFG